MLENLFTFLTESLYGSFGLALFASFTWGILSILLSPCHLSSISLIIGFLTSQGEKKTSALGRVMGDVEPYGKWFVAIVFFIVGLYLMDIIRLPDTGVGLRVPGIRSVVISAFALGLIFGIALGPCTFAYMAPILGIVYQLSTSNIPAAILLLLAF